EAGQVISLIGRNGVGKTTTMRSIIGLTPASSGKIIFQGTDITKLPAYKISRLGVGFVPEERRIFPQLSVWENLDIARRPAISGEGWDEERVFTLFPDLKDIQARPGGVLSGGQQQMLTIARTLMNNPSILLLDEPSEGLAPKVVEDLRDQVKLLKDTGLSIILAEQNLKFVLYLSDYCHILEKGEIKYSGSPEDLRAKPEILEQYLTL
ncbi:ABC transporter ATP-binding protein, partial [Alphaproteobacteria bacterium]|nr:ABC transporter ATP-binding protein [Alphaproteobacteria bacterium]